MKKLVITLVVLVAVLVAADFGAAAAAEYQVAQKMRTDMHLASDPEVRINGFPFLTQAVAGDYRDVSVNARTVRVGQLNDVDIETDLHHARIGLSDVLSGSADHLDVDELVGRVKLKSPDVGRLIGVDDLTINPAPKDALEGTDGEQLADGTEGDPTKATVQLNGTVNIAGTDNAVQVIGVLSVLGGKLKIEPKKLELNNSAFGRISLPKIFEQSVFNMFTATIDPGALPFRVTPTAVRAERGALVLEGTAQHVRIGPDGMSAG